MRTFWNRLLWNVLGVVCAAICAFTAIGTIGLFITGENASTAFYIASILITGCFGVAAVLCFGLKRKKVFSEPYAAKAISPPPQAVVERKMCSNPAAPSVSPLHDPVLPRVRHVDSDENPEKPNWAELAYTDVEALRFWNTKSTDFQVPQYYAATAFGRGAKPARERLLAGGYMTEGSPRKNIELRTIPELKAILAEKDLKTSGKKADLVQRLLDNVPSDELHDLFPVGVYEITEKGQKALNQYRIVEENKDYSLGFSFYRLMKAKEAHPDEEDGTILGRLIAEDMSECYRTGNRVRAEELLIHAAPFAFGYGDPEKALECAVLSYFLWAEEASRTRISNPNDTNLYLAATVEKYAIQCRFSVEQLLNFFMESIRRCNPFGLGTATNISYALAAFKKGLSIESSGGEVRFTRDPASAKTITAYQRRSDGREHWVKRYRLFEECQVLPIAGFPKTFQTFEKHMLSNSEKYQDWMRKYSILKNKS